MRAERTRIIAHRGASHAAPENTLVAFSRAVEMGADMIELDVQRSADGVLVVIHDDDTLRVAGGAGGAVAALTFDDLRRLDLGGSSIPTLNEVLDLVRAAGIEANVELKVPGVEEDAVALVLAAGLRDAALFSSFHVESLVRVRALDPTARLALLSGTETLRPAIRWREAYPLPLLHRLAAEAWHPHYRLLNRVIARAVHQAGYRINVWTVDRPAVMRRLIRLGVDGIITDEPDLLCTLLSETAGP
jgi:glycerophosphoryl diester phosphodiesterase